MGKQLIEIEKPERCKECPCYVADPWFGGSCRITKQENGWNKRIEADEEYTVQKWCPLIPQNSLIPVEWIEEKARMYDDLAKHVGGMWGEIYSEWADMLRQLVEKWRERK